VSVFDDLTERVRGTTAWRWYLSREPNERPIIAGVVLLVLAALVWLLVWKPISDWRSVADNRYQNAQATWSWMQANEADARSRAKASAASPGGGRSLLPLVTREANGQGIRLNRLQPEADGAVSVVIQAQPFNDVIQWLARLQNAHSVSVQRISVDAEGTPGLINAQIRMR
jgi:general secretion pathway protein M